MEKIKLEKIRKTYKDFSLKDLSFDVKEGYITGFIGANGSGKTTSIKSILSFIRPESGKIYYQGKLIDDYSYLKDLGVVLDSSFLPKDLLIKDIEKIMQIAYNNWNENLFYKLLDDYKIDKSLKVSQLSRGMSTKLMLAIALSHKAKTLILDEPTSGLDPSSREEFREIIQKFMLEDSKNTVLFSTHITSDLEKIADYILFIINGKKVFYGSKDDLLDEFRLVKGSYEDFEKIDKNIFIGEKNKESLTEALVANKDIKKLSEDFLIERPTIDEIMTFFNRSKDYE